MKAVNAFALYYLFIASGPILSYAWPIYLIRRLDAPDHLVITMGLIGSAIPPIAWLKSPSFLYKLGLALPIAVSILSPNPESDLSPGSPILVFEFRRIPIRQFLVF